MYIMYNILADEKKMFVFNFILTLQNEPIPITGPP